MAIPLIAAIALFSTGYFLRDSLADDAPQSTGYQEPYDLPFEGGQCLVPYKFAFKFTGQTQRPDYIGFANDRQSGYGTEAAAFGDNRGDTYGDIESITYSALSSFEGRIRIVGRNSQGTRINRDVAVLYGAFGAFQDFEILAVTPFDGSPDSCGDIPNPNPAGEPALDGLSSNGFNSGAAPVTVVEGLALAPLAPFASALAALLTAARIASALAAIAAAAGNIADAIGKIADAIGGIADGIGNIVDLLDKLKDFLEEKEKEEEKKKKILNYDFGQIRGDGFLRLYPSDAFDGMKCEQLDILAKSIPLGYGKYFGKLSPNYFEYKRLGHIAFVSASFGIMEKRDIEFGRSTFVVPSAAVGFYYHLGLDNVILADATALYTGFEV